MKNSPTDSPRAPRLRRLTAFPCALLALSLASCDQPKSTSEKAEPKVEGNVVILPANAAQSDSLNIAEAHAVDKPVVHVYGHLAWNDDLTVRIFPSVGGRVCRIVASPGDLVKTGDTLAEMASPDFGQAQADATRADADLKLSDRTLNRTRDLLKHGAAAEKDVEAAEDDYASKLAENQRAQSRLQLYGVSVAPVDGMFPLKAPISGNIVEKTINPGQEVRSDAQLANDPRIISPLFVISDPTKLWVVLDVTELDITTVKAGQKLRIHSRAYPDKVFEGRLEVIGDSLDPNTRTIKARGSVDNASRLLKAEMYVDVDIEIQPPVDKPHARLAKTSGSRQAANLNAGTQVPVQAVLSRQNQHYVFVEKNPGEYERCPVQIGLEDHGNVAVITGLSAGQRVVTDGCLLLESIMETSKGS
jgi:membrane fusion protein, heavy metal efflux system